MMDEDIVSKWTAALRSGEYKQVSGVLSNSNGFCCLGVLCDIIDPDAWSDGAIGRMHRGSSGYPSHRLYSQLGVTSSHMLSYADMNDDGKSFSEIADKIDQDSKEGLL